MVARPALALWLSLQKWRAWGSSRVSGVTGKSGGGGPAHQRATMSGSASSRPALSFRRHGSDARRVAGQVQRLGRSGHLRRASRSGQLKTIFDHCASVAIADSQSRTRSTPSGAVGSSQRPTSSAVFLRLGRCPRRTLVRSVSPLWHACLSDRHCGRYRPRVSFSRPALTFSRAGVERRLHASMAGGPIDHKRRRSFSLGNRCRLSLHLRQSIIIP